MKNFSKHKNLISFAILIPFCFLPFTFLDTNFEITSSDNSFIKRSSSNTSEWQNNDAYSIKQISAGDKFSTALVTDGNKDYLYTWGENVSGALGLGDDNNRNFPTLVTTLPEGNIEQISTGWNHTAAVVNDGSGDDLYTWGFNNVGQLGVENMGDFNGFTIPQEVKTLPEGNIEQISLGYFHSAAVVNDGSGDKLYTWGSNTKGQLGLGDEFAETSYITTPTQVTSLPKGNIEQISLGNDVSAAIVNENGDDHLYTWGANNQGQLGLGDSKGKQNTPTEVTTFSNLEIEQISMGYDNSAAVINNNRSDDLYTWGDNSDGQLGLGTNKSYKTPQEVTKLPEGDIEQIDLGGSRNYESNPYSAHSALILDDGSGDKLYTWGNNELGQLGLGDNKEAMYNTPQEVTALPDGEINQVALGGYHSIITINSKNNDHLYAWGSNDYGQLGFGKNYTKYIHYSDDSIPYYSTPYETYIFYNWYLQHWYYFLILIFGIFAIWIIIVIWIIEKKQLCKFSK